MITKKQIKLTPKKISYWITIIITILTLAALILVSGFLYNNFYQAITETKEIIILKEKVALDTIDMKKFNSIIDKLAEKTTPKKLNNANNPFN